MVTHVSKVPPPPSPFRRWGIQDAAFWFLAAQLLVGITATLALTVFDQDLDSASMGVLVLAHTGLWLGYGFGPILTSVYRGRGPVADYGANIGALDVPAGLLLGVFTQYGLLWVLYWPLVRWFIDEEPGEAAAELGDRVNTVSDALLLILMVVVIAPLAEELFYRGLLLSALRFHLGDWMSIVISSGIFALVHLQAVSIPGLFMFGLIAGYLRVKTGRLGLSLMFHAGFNAATVAVLLGFWDFL